MSFLDDLLNRRKVEDNTARIEREMRPLIQKANARNVQKLKSGQQTREQYQQQSDAVLKRQYNQPQNKARSSGAQALFPLMGSAGGLISRVPGNVATLAGNAVQDPLGSAVRGIEAVNPINYSIKAFNAVSPKDIPNPFQWREDKLANGASNATKSVTPQSVQNVQGSVGRGLERIGKTSDETITGILSNSELDPNARPGENRLVTNLSSGAGSLAASVGLSRLPGGTMLPSTVFGINSAGQQTRQARDAGKSSSEALNIGVQAGAAEAGLEKAGLDKFLGNIGNKGSIVNTLKNALVEGGQESAQSLAGSGISSQYQDVDWSNAGMQALQEGGLGALLGGGSTAIAGGIQGVANRPQAPKQVPLTPELQTKRDGLINAYTVAEDNGRPDLAEGIARQIDQIDNPAPGTLRDKIRSAKERLTIGNTQSGFIGDSMSDQPTIKNAFGEEVPNPDYKAPDVVANTNPLESLKQEAKPPANAFQDTLPSKSRPESIRELVKRGGNPLYHDTSAKGVLGILDSGEIKASQAPFSSIAGQGTRVSTTRNFDNYSRYGKSPYRFVIDETKTGQKAIPDNREEFESIFKKNVKTDSVDSLTIDITNPELINDMNNGRLAEVIAKAKEKGIRVETFEGKILPDEYANKEVQQMTKDKFTKEFGLATQSQPPKSPLKTDTQIEIDRLQKIVDNPSSKSITAGAYSKAQRELYELKNTKKPFTPLSQPVDNIPAVAKQVTNGSTSTKQDQSEIQPTSQAVLPNPKTSTQNKVQGSNQSKVRSQTIDSTDSASSSQENPLNNMGSIPSDEQLDNQTNQEASRPADEFGAVAANPKSKKTRVLVDAIKADTKLTDASRTAQMEGSELNYYAKKDDTGRSVGIEQFDPKNHRIEAGFVIDSNGKVLGNHIKVDDTGIQVSVGGEIVNIETIVGNPQDWDGNYRMMETMDRNIQRLAPDEATYRKTRRFTVDHKIKSEANFRTELKGQRQQLAERAKPVMKARPRGVSKSEYNADIFDFIEGNKTKAEITKKYGKVVSEKISTYQKETRKMYDDILERVNETFVKFGEPPVPKRADYLTHINELNSKPSFAGEIYGQLQNSILGEGMNTTRGTVPSDIAGRTENFQPRKKWNRFFQARNGGEFTKDPFKAVDAYLEPSLYNVHMTESAVRARAIEATFRTAEVIRKTDAKAVTEEFGKTIEKYGIADNSNLVTGFQEWANALSGKTQRIDRQIIDSGKGSALGLRSWQGLQRIGGRGTILGNVQSVLSQALNQPLTLADAGPINYVKGIATSLSKGTPIDQSNFITARATRADSDYRTRGGKVLDAGGVPLQAVELAMVKLTWNAQYHKAVADGYKGNEAVMEADRRTEQVVAGRGIADKPEAYRSTAYNGLLQYTLEVSASNKKFFQDLSTAQKAEFLVATMAMNSLMGLVTGTEPLPDLLGSIFDTAGDLLDDEDERTTAEKVGGGAKDLLGESVSMNPLLTAGANTFLSQDQRKAFFGDNSSIGRFEGTAAPVQVVRNTAGAVVSLAQGKYKDARNKALKSAPFGNQAQKTIRGAEALIDGYAVDSSGNPTYSVASDPINAGKVLFFGPNAAREARGYYDKNQTNITGKADTAKIEASSDKAKTVQEIQDARLAKRDKEGTISITDKSEKDSAGEYISRDKYDAVLNAYEKSDGKLDNIQKYGNDELKKAISDVSAEAKKVFTDSNLPTDGIKFDSRMARDYASFRKSVEGKDSIDNDKKAKTFITSTYKNTLDDTSKSFYTLGDDAMREKIQDGTISKAQMDKIIETDNLLTSEGLQDYMQVGKELRRELGYALVDSGSGKSSYAGKAKSKSTAKGGGKAKIDLSAYNSNKNQLDTFKRLDALLAGTRKPVSGSSKKVVTRKPVLKQIKVRA